MGEDGPWRLISCRLSPATELARWLLAREGIAFREEVHVLGLHALADSKASAHVPVVVTPRGEVWRGAAGVLEGLDRARGGQLLPTDETSRVNLLIEGLVTSAPRLLYGPLLGSPRGLLPAATHRAPRWERLFATGLYPLWRGLAARALNAGGGGEPRRQVEATLAAADGWLNASGADFLGGGTPGTADIVLSALAGPLVLPPAYGARLPALEDLPAETCDLVAATRARPCGRLVLRAYQTVRHPDR